MPPLYATLTAHTTLSLNLPPLGFTIVHHRHHHRRHYYPLPCHPLLLLAAAALADAPSRLQPSRGSKGSISESCSGGSGSEGTARTRSAVSISRGGTREQQKTGPFSCYLETRVCFVSRGRAWFFCPLIRQDVYTGIYIHILTSI